MLLQIIIIIIIGPDAASLMRSKLKYEGKIIGITGNGLVEDIRHFIKCGADRVIIKPLNSEKLFNEMIKN